MDTRLLSLWFALLIIVQVLGAVGFAIFSDGFYTASNGSLFRCSELQSSGGDDEVVVLVFVGLILSMLVRVFRFRQGANTFEASLYFGLLLAGSVVSFGSIDCGSIHSTLIGKMDVYLWVFFAAGLSATCMMIFLVKNNK